MQQRTYIIPGLFLVVLFFSCTKEDPEANGGTSAKATNAQSCGRVVSLAPSITEMLFSLGLEDRVVGVTEYCHYPPAAKTKASIGGYASPNYELIVDLKPNVVFLLDLHEKQAAHLAQLGKTTVTCKTEHIVDILDSLRSIGDFCGVSQRAKELSDAIVKKLQLIGDRTKDRARPRVLIALGRSMGTGSLKEVFAAGRDTFFNEVIELAGGENAISSGSVMYPRLSAEGIMAVNPDVIIDLVVGLEDKDLDLNKVLEHWKDTPQIGAVKNDRLHVFSQDYVVLPGPRIVLLVEQLARVLHPDIDWSDS